MVKVEKLNKFEESRLLSARAEEIAAGDKPKVKLTSGKINLTKDYVEIAKEEFESGKLDLEIYKE